MVEGQSCALQNVEQHPWSLHTKPKMFPDIAICPPGGDDGGGHQVGRYRITTILDNRSSKHKDPRGPVSRVDKG